MKGSFINICLAAALAAAGVALGFNSAADSWNGTVIVHSQLSDDDRSPAAIRRAFDFSHLEGSALRLASQRRLVTDARVILAPSKVGVELGHFVTKDASGSRLFACEYYDRISLTFEAEGVATSGEKPTMKVDGPCAMGDDLNRMAPIRLPTELFEREKPVDREFAVDDASFQFENMPSSWPRAWALTSIRVFNSTEKGREISISRAEIHDMSDQSIRVVW